MPKDRRGLAGTLSAPCGRGSVSGCEHRAPILSRAQRKRFFRLSYLLPQTFRAVSTTSSNFRH